jgi:glycosyltransferase involved in cell wall biosynthesis
MTLGTPVLTSNVTSLPEIAGDAALLVDPFDVSAMAAAIRRLDHDADLLKELSSRGRTQAALYSMDNYVRRLSNVYRGILGSLPGGDASIAG